MVENLVRGASDDIQYYLRHRSDTTVVRNRFPLGLARAAVTVAPAIDGGLLAGIAVDRCRQCRK